MTLENEICKKVYDHHTVLKSELSNALLETGTKHGISREALVALSNVLNGTVDMSSNKLVVDFQRSFSKLTEQE